MTSGCRAWTSIDQPFPEPERLGVRVVDAEDPDAALDPEQRDVEQRLPQRAPVVAVEVERVDVLVLLRRILGVLDRAVGPMAEPLGMLADPRMIGRALPGEIERDFEAEPLGLARGTPSKSSSVPRPGSTAVWPPAARSDGPRAAGIARLRDQRVVAALCGSSCRSGGSAAGRRRRSRDRRCAAAARRASRNVPLRVGSGPAERGNISYHAPNRARSRSTQTRERRTSVARGPVGVHRHHRGELVGRAPRRRVARAGVDVAERVGVREQPGARPRARPDLFGARGRLANEQRAFEQLQRDILAVRGLQPQIAPPRQEAIDPGDDRDTRASRSPPTSKHAVHSSVPGAARVIGVSRHPTRCRAGPVSASAAPRPQTCRSRSTATITSWPSAKMSAVTVTDSPTVRLIGNRPPSICRRDALDDDALAERLPGSAEASRSCRGLSTAVDRLTVDCRLLVATRLALPTLSAATAGRLRQRAAALRDRPHAGARGAAAPTLNTATDRPCSGYRIPGLNDCSGRDADRTCRTRAASVGSRSSGGSVNGTRSCARSAARAACRR